MKKITITTWYEIEDGKKEIRTLKASTEVNYDPNIPSALNPIFDLHTEKCGSIERKIAINPQPSTMNNAKSIARQAIERSNKPLNKYNTAMHMDTEELTCETNDRTAYDVGTEQDIKTNQE